MTKLKLIGKALLGATALTVFSTASAFAAGTDAGTSVSNTFTLDYSVGGVAQDEINNTAAPTLFTVDRVIDLNVLAQPTATTVFPGSTDATLLFTLTNTGNDNQSYNLAFVDDATTDDFDTSAQTYYVLGVAAGTTCDAATTVSTGTVYTPGPTAVSPDVLPDAMLCIVLEGDVASSETDGNVSDVTLTANTFSPSGDYLNGGAPAAPAEETADDGTNAILGAAENVLADGAGATDAALDGAFSDTATFIVASADLAGAKTVVMVSTDGSGCASVPSAPSTDVTSAYAVPDACVEYVITVTNNGSVAATDIDISDALPGDVTYVAATAVGFNTTTPGTVAESAGTVTLTGATLDASEEGHLIIRATIN